MALAAVGVSAIVLVFFMVDTARNEPETFAVVLIIMVLAVAFDTLWKWRHPLPESSAPLPNPQNAPGS